MCSFLRGVSRWFTPLACGPGYLELCENSIVWNQQHRFHSASSEQVKRARAHRVMCTSLQLLLYGTSARAQGTVVHETCVHTFLEASCEGCDDHS